jgi:hypothetical protein
MPWRAAHAQLAQPMRRRRILLFAQKLDRMRARRQDLPANTLFSIVY